SHAVVYGGQSSYQVTRGGPDGTGRPPREWTSLYQGTTYGASGYKSHIHAMERPVPIVPASPRPATSRSHSGFRFQTACLAGTKSAVGRTGRDADLDVSASRGHLCHRHPGVQYDVGDV